ncbi:hypothetical protein G6F56_005116 [Rhizopus delemar]|nr:hypothetical protein G6F56_005116 [Rhizopus delemar]
MKWLFFAIWNNIYQKPGVFLLYRLFKCIYGYLTETTEINRILCLPTLPYRLYRLDNALYYSKELVNESRLLKQSDCNLGLVKTLIIQKKLVDYSLHDSLTDALNSIHAAYRVLEQVNNSVLTPYDSQNKEHEEKLSRLWKTMKPNEPLKSRISSQWVDIGFQGTDPATDFRGMGIQGLDDLLYFTQHYPQQVQSILQHANHPQQWYPYAIVGINISKFTFQLLESRKLQLYLFGNEYQELYCYLFYSFDRSWRFTVMEFEEKFKEFQFIVEKELKEQEPMRIQYTNIQ